MKVTGDRRRESGLCSASDQNKLEGCFFEVFLFFRWRPTGHHWLQSPSLSNQNIAAGRLMKMEKLTKWPMEMHVGATKQNQKTKTNHPLVIRTLET